MQLGIDASGKFSTAEGFEPSVLAGAVMPAAASAEIAAWTAEAIDRWGADRLTELHAKEMSWDARSETCQMLAARDDIRLTAVVTDQLLLGSAAAVAKHRERQLDKLRTRPDPRTSEGRELRKVVEGLLEDERLADHEYVLGALIPLVAFGSLQQTLCYFRTDEWRSEMTEIRVLADQEAPRTAKYCATSLFPVLGGDPRFRPIVDSAWRDEPMHPLYAKALHPDGDGLRPHYLLNEMEWVSSHDHVPVQVADVAAWVVRRAVARPHEAIARECFELLRPLLEGEGGRTFELFSPRRLKPEDAALYAHLQLGEQPPWWLVRLAPATA